MKIFSGCLILTFLLASPAQAQVFSLQLTAYFNDTIVVHSFSLKEARLTSHFPTSYTGYVAKLIAFNQSVLATYNLPISFVVLDLGVLLNQTELTLQFPLFEDAQRLELYAHEKLIAILPIPWCNQNGRCDSYENFQKCPEECHCGNKRCEVNYKEHYGNCPTDCPSGQADNYCDKVYDGVCDPDCLRFGMESRDVDCIGIPTHYFLILASACVLIGVLLFLRVKRVKD